MNHLYPVFLKAERFETLIVGGGNVGFEKTAALLGNSPLAKVVVVAPLIREEIVELQKIHPGLKIIQRPFLMADLDAKSLVICATDNPELHEEIYKEAKSRRLLINVADTPTLCDFYLGSIVTKGDLKLAISTNGKSPTFAKRLKEVLMEALPENMDVLLEQLNRFRDQLKGDFAEKVRVLNEHTRSLVEKKAQE